jgi:hypothetical protein
MAFPLSTWSAKSKKWLVADSVLVVASLAVIDPPCFLISRQASINMHDTEKSIYDIFCHSCENSCRLPTLGEMKFDVLTVLCMANEQRTTRGKPDISGQFLDC